MVAYTSYSTDARVIKQAETAIRAGYSVDFLTLKEAGKARTEVLHQVRIFRLGVEQYDGGRFAGYLVSYLHFFLRCFIRVTMLHIKKRYRIIHVNNMPDILVFTTLLPKLCGAKIILDIHDPMPEIFRAKFKGSSSNLLYHLIRLLEKWSVTYANKVLTVNEPVKNCLIARTRIPEGKITVVANYPDAMFSKGADHYDTAFPVRMVYHGTIAERYGFEDALRALSAVEQRENMRLTIIGESSYGTILTRLIEDLGLENTVHFENKRYPLAQLPDLLRHFHLGFVPYERSPAIDYILPVKLLELLSLGIPAITFQSSTIESYLDKSMYFTYSPECPQTLTDVVNQIIMNPALLLEKRNAILHNQHPFRWEQEAEKYLQVIRRLAT